jgi:16S rRNA (uracil1498-N3)-methyltransferase
VNLPYFYEPFTADTIPVFSDASMHHALHVLRMASGDECMLVNGFGTVAHCRIVQAGKKSCSLDVLSISQENESSNQLHIAIAFTKNSARIEWFLEKATEIGVRRITPLITKRSEKIHQKHERFEKILLSAMLQSQQAYLPILSKPASLTEVLQGEETLRLIAHCEEGKNRNLISDYLQQPVSTLILIGPEGDFTPEEIDFSLKHQCHPVHLGHNRLRTETAGLFVCVAYNMELARL